MTKYILGKDLLDLWKIKPFELFHHIKDGLQPHNKFGKPQPPPDIVLKLNRLSDLKKEFSSSKFAWLNLPQKEKDSIMETVREVEWGPQTSSTFTHIPMTKEQNKKYSIWLNIIASEHVRPQYEIVKREIKDLENELAKIKNKYSWGDYDLPENTSQAEWVINSLLSSYYKRTDVAEIGKKYSTEDPQAKRGEESESEKFVRSIRIAYESDLDVKIQPPRRPAETFSHREMGFARSDTKAWRMLLEIFQSRGFKFNLGFPAHYWAKYVQAGSLDEKTDKDDPRESWGTGPQKRLRGKEYDARRKMLDSINRKLLTFFNKKFSVNLPKDFLFYKHLPQEKSGTYQLKFSQAKNSDPIDF